MTNSDIDRVPQFRACLILAALAARNQVKEVSMNPKLGPLVWEASTMGGSFALWNLQKPWSWSSEQTLYQSPASGPGVLPAPTQPVCEVLDSMVPQVAGDAQVAGSVDLASPRHSMYGIFTYQHRLHRSPIETCNRALADFPKPPFRRPGFGAGLGRKMKKPGNTQVCVCQNERVNRLMEWPLGRSRSPWPLKAVTAISSFSICKGQMGSRPPNIGFLCFLLCFCFPFC